jgi:transcriptional regulator with XRE-family HTH domain
MDHLLSLEDIRKLARECRKKKQLSQYATAAELNVGQADIEQAEHSTGGELLEIQLRMIREIGGYEVEGPFYRIAEDAVPDASGLDEGDQ